MSKILTNGSPAQIAPAFPGKGHLALKFSEVVAQRRRQQQEVADECLQAREQAAAQGLPPPPTPCAQVLNISLFFDGTNNHEPSDSKADPVCTSNIARLFHATINDKAAMAVGYYTYYLQGVGTKFEEIGENSPDAKGLRYASGGERRILWGLTRLIDALSKAISTQDAPFPDDTARTLIGKMEYTRYKNARDQDAVRSALKQDRIAAMGAAMQSLLPKLQTNTPKVLRMKLFVYGFSRGAAEARAFVGRLQELCQDGQFYGIPLSVEFLGLMDTVASVGVASLIGGASGHDGWADNTMQLPAEPSILRQCAHLVSAHEQRLCFPLDSVRRKDGSYPACCGGDSGGEWVYPGVHSDVGGGYGPGEQGKASKEQGLLISQIPLHHMYALAFKAGAPLMVDPTRLIDANPEKLKMLQGLEPWRLMTAFSTQTEFDFNPEMVKRFEKWRLMAGEDAPLAAIIADQTAQITAWRILRYAGGLHSQRVQDLNQAPYFQRAPEDSQPLIDAKEAAWTQVSKAGGDVRQVNITPQGSNSAQPYQVNADKDFEPTMDQSELKQGASDFSDDYRQVAGLPAKTFEGVVASFFLMFTRPFAEDHWWEYYAVKDAGEKTFPGVIADQDLMDLYDEHIHDSRCWFMYSSFKGLEPYGSYFRYRTVYFSDGETNKDEMVRPATLSVPSTQSHRMRSN